MIELLLGLIFLAVIFPKAMRFFVIALILWFVFLY